jgi:hypothetical protein
MEATVVARTDYRTYGVRALLVLLDFDATGSEEPNQLFDDLVWIDAVVALVV